MRPQVSDDRVTIDARTLTLALDTRHLEAEGAVRSVLQPGETKGPADAARLPALLSGRTPVFVTGARLAYDGAPVGGHLHRRRAALAGRHASCAARRSRSTRAGATSRPRARCTRSWRSPPSRRRRSESKEGERAAEPAAPKPAGTTAPAKAGPTVADAGELDYDDAARRAAYTHAARVNGPEGDLRAARIELFLAAEGGTLTRVEAFDDVTAILEEKYTVTGSHLTYTVADERYVVEGAPVRALEKRPTDCLETVGTILTFLRSADTINVDGTDGNRSRTRPVPCPGRHP